MIYYIFVLLFIGFEIQKIFQFNYFFKMRTLSADYPKKVLNRTKSVLYKETLKLVFIDMLYLIICVIGLFTINKYFFLGILILSTLHTLIFKIKNKTIKKIYLAIDISFSIILLSLAIINFLYYQLDGIQFIQQLFNL
jgi:hypothetical protein